MAEIKKNTFTQLYTIDVNEHTEKKNGLTYLSWAWAWAEFKKKFPKSYYTIYENKDGYNYFTDGVTCWVKTGVTLVDDEDSLELIEYLPVMDFKNKSIPISNVTSMDVNKAIQRSLTKAIAKHGLGLYIYAGEDLPDVDEDTKAIRKAEANEKAELAKQLVAVKSAITSELIRLTKEMTTKEEKQKFATEHVTPFVKTRYQECTDIEQLNALLIHLNEIK